VLGCVHVVCGETSAAWNPDGDHQADWVLRDGSCCGASDAPYFGVDLTDMRVGSEIQFGPLGQPISGLGFV